MIKCKICGSEQENRRQMHGHMMRNHYDQYKAAGFDMDDLTEGAPLRAHVAQALKDYPRPAGFRRIRRSAKPVPLKPAILSLTVKKIYTPRPKPGRKIGYS